MKRIGLSQRVTIEPDYGERRDCLDQAWSRLLIKLGLVPIPLVNSVIDAEEYVNQLQLDGIILTGGNDICEISEGNACARERDSFEHKLIAIASDRNLPLLGVCRGAQMINIFYGGSIIAVEGHVTPAHILILAESNESPLGNLKEVNSYHNYGIKRNCLANSLKALGWAPDDTVEVFAHKEKNIVGIMWHPERAKEWLDADRRLIKSLFNKKWPSL